MNNTFLNVPEAYQGRLIEVVGADMAPPDRAVLYSTIQAIQPTSQAPTDLRARLETTCVSSRCGQRWRTLWQNAVARTLAEHEVCFLTDAIHFQSTRIMPIFPYGG
jgi:hypothetical protein